MKWDIDADDLENTEASDYEPYNGELLPPGLYPLSIQWIKTTPSSQGNDMLTILMTFDNPDDDEELADYVGCPVWDRITVQKSTLFRLKPFLDAIGVSYEEFASSTVVDDEEKVTKIGSVRIDGLTVRARVRVEKSDEYDDKLRPTRYLPAEESVKPAAKKAKAATGKKSTKKAKPVEDDDEAPF
jgi:hypothetical protein